MKSYDLATPHGRFYAHLEVARALALLGKSDEYHVSRYLGADHNQVRRVLTRLSEHGAVKKTKTQHGDDTPQQLWQGDYGFSVSRGWGQVLCRVHKKKALPDQDLAKKRVISHIAAKRPRIDFGMIQEHKKSFKIMRFSTKDDVYEIAQLAMGLTPEQRVAVKELMKTIGKNVFTSSSE